MPFENDPAGSPSQVAAGKRGLREQPAVLSLLCYRKMNATALKLTTRISDDVTAVDLSGRLTLGSGPAALRGLLQEITAGGGRKIVLNLKDVSFIDSSGLGELVSSHVNAKHNGVSLKMVGVPKRVQEMFELTGVYRILDIHDNEPDAIRSWA